MPVYSYRFHFLLINIQEEDQTGALKMDAVSESGSCHQLTFQAPKFSLTEGGGVRPIRNRPSFDENDIVEKEVEEDDAAAKWRVVPNQHDTYFVDARDPEPEELNFLLNEPLPPSGKFSLPCLTYELHHIDGG